MTSTSQTVVVHQEGNTITQEVSITIIIIIIIIIVV